MMEKYQNRYRIASSRLQGWDYGCNAAYFATICTHNRAHFFGHISNDQMVLSDVGEIAQKYWYEIPQHFPFILLGAFVVMPNHIHGILIIDKPDDGCDDEDINGDGINDGDDTVETLHATSLPPQPPQTLSQPTVPTSSSPPKNETMASISPKQGSLSTIIRSYKSAVTKYSRPINPDFAWQPRFHDHIIRNDASYERISHYIIHNPIQWQDDKFF